MKNFKRFLWGHVIGLLMILFLLFSTLKGHAYEGCECDQEEEVEVFVRFTLGSTEPWTRLGDLEVIWPDDDGYPTLNSVRVKQIAWKDVFSGSFKVVYVEETEMRQLFSP